MTEQRLYLPEYCIITSKVRNDVNLTGDAKIFCGELAVLSSKHGYCWGSDEELAEMKGASDRTIQRWLNSMEEGGHIFRETVSIRYKNLSGQWLWKRDRKIWVGDGALKKRSDIDRFGGIDDPDKIGGMLKGKGKIEKNTNSTPLQDEEKKKVEDDMRKAGVNAKTIERAMKYSIKDIDDALHNLSFKDICGDVSGYFFDQLKNMKEYGRRKGLAEAKEEVAKENKSFTIKNLKQFEGRQLGIAKATELRICEMYVEFVLNANCPSKVFEYLSPKFKVDVIGYLEKIGEDTSKIEIIKL